MQYCRGQNTDSRAQATKLYVKVKIKQSRNRPGVAQKDPGGLGSEISMTFQSGEVVSLTHRPHLPLRMFLVLIFTRG